MGALTYLFGFIVDAIVGLLVALLAALLAGALPVKLDAGPRRRTKRAVAVGLIVWFLFVGYGCATMGDRREHEEDPSAALVESGLSSFGLVGVQSVQVYRGDAAQTYTRAKATSEGIKAIEEAYPGLERQAFEAHTVVERGWPAPDWWPKSECATGYELNESFSYGADKSTEMAAFTLNWCPSTGTAYIQYFDY